MGDSEFLFVLMIAYLALAVIFFLWRWSAFPTDYRRRGPEVPKPKSTVEDKYDLGDDYETYMKKTRRR